MNVRTTGTFTIGALIGLGLLVAGAVSAWAQPEGWGGWGRRSDPDSAILTDAYTQVLMDLGDGTLGELNFEKLKQELGKLSVARQEYAFVKRSEIASYFVPGAGQFMNGAPGTGALFLAGNLVVIAGTIAGAYLLLPSDLHFDRLNWFTSPYSTVESSFEGHSFVDYLPSLGILVGGAIVDQILRAASARNAGSLAREGIRDGKITFQPEPLLLPPVGGHGPWSYGLGWGLWF